MKFRACRTCEVIRVLSNIYFLILFSFYRPPKDRTKLPLNLDGWKTIYLKIIALFLSVFFDVQLSSFSRCAVLFRQAAKNFFEFFFLNWFYVCFIPLFSGVFLNVVRYSKKMEILLYSVSVFPLKWKISSFLLIQLSRHFSCGKDKTIIPCFLTSYTH